MRLDESHMNKIACARGRTEHQHKHYQLYRRLVSNQATGYASQHWCLSQARINWEGCARKGIGRKNSVDDRDGGTNWSGWGGSPSGLLVCLPVFIFILHQKIQKMVKCTFWYQLTRVVLDKVQRVVKWLCMWRLVLPQLFRMFENKNKMR